MKITPLQNKRLHKLLADIGLMAWKADYVIKYSNGRTSHSSEISHTEAQGIINELILVKAGKELPINNPNYGVPVHPPTPPMTPPLAGRDRLFKGGQTPPTQNTDFEKADKLRKAVISKFITMGAITDTGKSDIPFINQVLERKWHKNLNNLTKSELQRLIAVLNTKLLPWYYKNKEMNPDFNIKG